MDGSGYVTKVYVVLGNTGQVERVTGYLDRATDLVHAINTDFPLVGRKAEVYMYWCEMPAREGGEEPAAQDEVRAATTNGGEECDTRLE